MRRYLAPAALLALLTVSGITGCGKDSGSPTDPSAPGGLPGGPGGSGSGSGGSSGGAGSSGGISPGDTLSGPGVDSAITNGGWTNPDGTTPTIEPVDSTQFTPTDTSSAGTDAGSTSTSLVFLTSGVARYGNGTCGPDGTWTDAQGQTYGPHNPNCIAYTSDGSPGNNGKGQCVSSPEGFPGLWLNPQGHPTSPYHSHCLRVGSSSTTLALSFPAEAVVYSANDGSGTKILNLFSQGSVVAQLIYHGDADGTTTGAGILVGIDNASPAHIWTVDFAQPALNYTAGVANGDLVSALQGSGVEVVGCNTAIGCSLVTLRLGATP
jgi:hypothetical protein